MSQQFARTEDLCIYEPIFTCHKWPQARNVFTEKSQNMSDALTYCSPYISEMFQKVNTGGYLIKTNAICNLDKYDFQKGNTDGQTSSAS